MTCYRYYPGSEMYNRGNYYHIDTSLNGDIDGLMAYADAHDECVGFTTDGYFFDRLYPIDSWVARQRYDSALKEGLYVKNSYEIPKWLFIDNCTPRDNFYIDDIPHIDNESMKTAIMKKLHSDGALAFTEDGKCYDNFYYGTTATKGTYYLSNVYNPMTGGGIHPPHISPKLPPLDPNPPSSPPSSPQFIQTLSKDKVSPNRDRPGSRPVPKLRKP